MLPAWPSKIILGGFKQGANRLITPDGEAEIARYVLGATAYFDANELCRRDREKAGAK